MQISKQRRHQLELRAAGMCQTCGKPRKEGDDYYCTLHRIAHNTASKKWYHKKKNK
jgi:hypothetical protein